MGSNRDASRPWWRIEPELRYACAEGQQTSSSFSPAILPHQRIKPRLQLVGRAVIPDAAEQIVETLVGSRLALDAIDRLHADDILERTGGQQRQHHRVGLYLKDLDDEVDRL